MQGEPLSSSLIFNVVVVAVVIRELLHQTFNVEAARSGPTMEQMAIHIIMVSVYVDGGVLSARDPVCPQNTFT
jgi:hypothetical protein